MVTLRTLSVKAITRLLTCTFIFVFNAFCQFANAQAPPIEWQKTVGGSGDDFGKIINAGGGTYFTYGTTSSSDGDFTVNRGSYDAFLAKHDSSGNVIWQRTYGGSGDDAFTSLMTSPYSEDLFAIGYTSSNNDDVSGNHGGYDAWVVKINSGGDITKQHCYGGSGDDFAYGSSPAKEQRYFAFSGHTNSSDGDVSGNHGGRDGWIVEGNRRTLNIQWSQCFGGPDDDDLDGGIVSTNHDNSLMVAIGSTRSSNGGSNHGGSDVFMVRVGAKGNRVVVRCFGGSGDEFGNALIAIGYRIYFTGFTDSHNGDVSGQHGNGDIWVGKVKLGHLEWQKCLGNATDMEAGFGIMPMNVCGCQGGEIVVLGASGPVSDHFSLAIAQATKLDVDGNELWTTTFGGSNEDEAFSGVPTADGGFLLGCYTRSTDGDVTNQHGEGDLWLVKFGADGEKISSPNEMTSLNELKNYPNPFSQFTVISFQLATDENISVKIFDAEGRLVRTFALDELSAGTHEFTWDARDENGNEVNTGIYFLKIQTPEFSKTEKLMVSK